MHSYIVALTGASGATYGIRLIGELLRSGFDVDMVASPTARLIAEDELGLSLGGTDIVGAVRDYLKLEGGGQLRYYPSDLLTAPIASGSALKRSMVVCPCSMGTIGRIASGVSTNLIERAADCILKEDGQLVLVPRETPFNTIHLENMLRLANAGARIAPAMPAFYTNPASIDDMVSFVVGKILDLIGVENDLYKRWEGDRV